MWYCIDLKTPGVKQRAFSYSYDSMLTNQANINPHLVQSSDGKTTVAN